jgi:DNA-binding MarR family transcriptional regulator
MLDKNSNASRLVEKLVHKELIERTVSKYDRRQRDVLITEKGLELLGKIDLEFEELEKQFTKLDVEEAKQLNDLLDRLRG